jgi:WD40 repeat protein
MKICIWFIFSLFTPTLFSDLSAASPIRYSEKPAGSVLELREAVPTIDVQRIVMGYLDSWGNPIKVVERHQKSITGLAYSAYGNYVASACENGCLKLWYAQHTQSQALKTLQSPQEEATAFALSRDGETLALAVLTEMADFIKIIDLKNNKCEVKQVLEGYKSKITSLAFSPDSKYIVSGSFDQTIKIWHQQNKKYELTQTLEEEETVSAVIFFAQGKNIISGCFDGTLKIWEYNQKNNKFEYKQNLPNNACAVNPLPTPLVTEGAAEIVNGMNKYLADSLNKRKRVSVFNITSSFDETILAISSGSLIELWSYQDAQWICTQWICTQKIDQNAIKAAPIAFSSDNTYFATGEGDNIKIYKLNQNKQYECIQTISDLKDHVTTLLFSPDNISLIYGLSDGSIEIIKNQARELYAHVRADKQEATCSK